MVTTQLNLPNPCHGNQCGLSTSATYHNFSSLPLGFSVCFRRTVVFIWLLKATLHSSMWLMGTVGQCAVWRASCPRRSTAGGPCGQACSSWCGVVSFHLNKSMAPTDADSSIKCVWSCLVFDNIIWTQENTS